MRFKLAAMALAIASVVAGHALGQAWAAVTTDQNKNLFELDMSSITANGGFTSTWVRQTMAHKGRDVVSGKAYSRVVMQRMDDCRARTFGVVAFVYQDEKGQVVSSTSVPASEWRFVAPPPGSVADGLQARICAVAGQRATLKPGLGIGPTTKANWLPTAFDPASQTRYFIQEDGVIALDAGAVGVIVRADNATPRKLPDGNLATTSYLGEAIDCKARTVAVMAVDSYDAAGNLVSVFAPPTEKIEVQTFTAGSSSDLIANYACQKDHIAQRGGTEEQEGAVYTGTGWLGPKGYLITANHVVEKATKLDLMLDGKIVGDAEVVVLDPANDIAILKPRFKDGQHLAIGFAPAPARLGERVFTLGYPAPDMLGVSLKMTSGEVSAMAGNDVATGRSDDARFLQVSMPIHSGNSGGPVIDDQGRAVGIVISKMFKAGDDEVAQNVNYALKIGYVRNLLSELPTIGAGAPAKPNPSLSGLVAELKGSVFLVIASSEASAKE